MITQGGQPGEDEPTGLPLPSNDYATLEKVWIASILIGGILILDLVRS